MSVAIVYGLRGGGWGCPVRESTEVPIYKILLPDEWAQFQDQGRFNGSPFDVSSGFIHCSSRAQVSATASEVFPDESALVLVALDEHKIGDVRWEPAPNGGPFPHVYGVLPYEAIVAVHHVGGAVSVEDVLPDEQ